MCRGEPRPSVPAALRARGRLNAAFALSAAGTTRVESLEEMGGYRMRFPRTHGRSPGLARPAAGPACEGAIINTGGGMAGGDRLAIAIDAGAGTNVLLSTPSAERIYGSAGPETEIAVSLRLGENARLAWLPRETILFSGARLARRLDVHMPASATLILAEATIFGRLARGEELVSGLFADRWRIRRDDRLLHAEQSRLEGAIGASLDRPAIGKGARAAATVIMVSPQAEDRLGRLAPRSERAEEIAARARGTAC